MTNNVDEALGHGMKLFYVSLLSTDLLWTLSNTELPLMVKQQNDFCTLKNIQEQMKLTVTFTYWSRIKCIHVIMNAKFRVLITFLTIDDEIQ